MKEGKMIKMDNDKVFLVGPKGSISINSDDLITIRLGMLYEGECTGNGRTETAKKFGYTRQRYHQLLQKYNNEGAEGLKNKKRGPKGNYKRTDEVVREVIKHKFLDPNSSPEVITQKLKQCGHQIANRSVERVISDYGLQKKTPYSSTKSSI